MGWAFERNATPVARKIHKCYWCREPIVKNEKHYYQVGIYNGDWNDWRMHLDCQRVSDPPDIEDYLCENKHERGKRCGDCDNSIRSAFTG